MFKNPLGRAVMTSSGAIPVRRNPNNLSSGMGSAKGKEKVDLAAEGEELAARASLFRETTQVLKNDGVVGIFPEGTSCTGWRVFQTMPGVAWAALEYTRAMQGVEGAPGVKIVPVAITYTDKSKYLSRVSDFLVFSPHILLLTIGASLADTHSVRSPQVASVSLANGEV